MEPCRGGKLAVLSDENSSKLKPFRPDASDASYAFRFLQGLDNIKMVLSGMNEVSQAREEYAKVQELNDVADQT